MPSNPQQVGYVSGPGSLWRDVKVYDQYAYIVSEGGSGIQVVSLANIDSGQVTLSGVVNDVGTALYLCEHLPHYIPKDQVANHVAPSTSTA